MIRRKLAPLFLALGLLGGTVAVSVTQQPAAAVGVIKTLWNGNCAVKIGFGPSFAWLQVWTSGCRYVSVQATDSGCWCWSYKQYRSNAAGIPVNTYIQSGTVQVNGACIGRSSYFAFVETTDNHGWFRNGSVSLWGVVTNW